MPWTRCHLRVWNVGLAAAGKIPIVLAAVLHLVGSVIVIFNSARLVRFGEELAPHATVAAQPGDLQ